jgi:hypothetical protein
MGLVKLLTDPGNFKFYSGGIGSVSTSAKFGQKLIPFGKDRLYGGKSNQPYISTPNPFQPQIGEPGLYSQWDGDFLWRGGILGPLRAAKDVLRLTQYFVDTKTPSGIFFSLKQNLLSRIGTKTEASKGPSYSFLGIAANEGVYTPLSTLFQSGVGFTGKHYLKQGIDPTETIPNLTLTKYQDALKNSNSLENFENANRLVKLTNLIQNKNSNDGDFNNIKKYTLNSPGDLTLISYSGGPSSNIGVGNTEIKFATDNGGSIPIKSILGPQSPQIGKPLDQIEPNKFQLPIGASKKYFEFDSNIPITSSNAGINAFLDKLGDANSWGYNFTPSVYEFNSILELNSITTDKKYLTRTDPFIQFTRTSGSSIYISPINNRLRASGTGSTLGVEGSGRQIIIDPTFNSTLGSFTAIDPIGTFLGQYSSENTLFNDNLNQTYKTSPKSHNKGYLANLDKNSGYYYDSEGKLAYVLNQYPRGIAPDFRRTNRKIRGFTDAPNNYDKITESSDYIGNGAKIIDKIYYDSSTQERKSSQLNQENDLIDFNIKIINGATKDLTTLFFRAYVEDFSDGYSSTWANSTYMGRGENFYKYTSFSRTINVSFIVVADNIANLDIMYSQLNTLASSLAPSYTSQGYMAGNLHQLTFGNYVKNQYGVLTGLSLEPPSESPWETKKGKQLPHYIKVTGLKFDIIHNFRPEYGNNRQFINQTEVTKVST